MVLRVVDIKRELQNCENTWSAPLGHWEYFPMFCRQSMLCRFWLSRLSAILLFFPFTKSWKSECFVYFHVDLLGKYYLITAITTAEMYFCIFLWIYIAAAVKEWWMYPRFHFLLCFSCTCLMPSLEIWHFMVSKVWFTKKKKKSCCEMKLILWYV